MRTRALQASKTDKDLVLRMKLECLDKPAGLTQNVELPPEARSCCVHHMRCHAALA